ncbi:rod shape-determining protein MreD [Cellvibrio japonicus]|uniref:Rod shape-determining protein MreD n=1 Tax=Cellvibrio japonicus (strain Ueda107) TaxID=498211 RepID=B3PC04_CELJU|nr:rod shape-determining protein MreD [Cellvibrio japonicus]ACE83403.1 putative rod shape-determining protein MreD [Cellvibrio japonicus Ueda107]
MFSRVGLWAMMLLSYLLALILSVYPLPFIWQWWRPEFVLVVAIYWMLNMPQSVSLVFLCVLGLFQDLLESVPFGQHSLGLIIVAYICFLSYQRVRNFPRWKQAGWVFVLVGIAQLTDNWVQSMAGRQLSGVAFLYPAVTSAIFWPFCCVWLDRLCQRYQLH